MHRGQFPVIKPTLVDRSHVSSRFTLPERFTVVVVVLRLVFIMLALRQHRPQSLDDMLDRSNSRRHARLSWNTSHNPQEN